MSSWKMSLIDNDLDSWPLMSRSTIINPPIVKPRANKLYSFYNNILEAMD